MNREDVVRLMNNPHITHHAMLDVCIKFAKLIHDVDFNPSGQINMHSLERAYNHSLQELSRHFAIHLLHDKNNKLVKIF